MFDSSLRGRDARKDRAGADGFAGCNCTQEQVKEARLSRSFLQDGAGLGDVGVKGIDNVVIFLFDDAALEF